MNFDEKILTVVIQKKYNQIVDIIKIYAISLLVSSEINTITRHSYIENY